VLKTTFLAKIDTSGDHGFFILGAFDAEKNILSHTKERKKSLGELFYAAGKTLILAI